MNIKQMRMLLLRAIKRKMCTHARDELKSFFSSSSSSLLFEQLIELFEQLVMSNVFFCILTKTSNWSMRTRREQNQSYH